MSRRLLVVLVALGVLATGGGVAGGLLLASDPGPATEAAGPTTIPETTAPVTSEPASSTSSTESSSTTSTTSGLDLQAQVVERAEDGVLVRYDASEPVARDSVAGRRCRRSRSRRPRAGSTPRAGS